MKVIEIAFVVYAVTDLQRGREFYEGVFGLKPTKEFVKDNQGMIEYDIGAGTLAIGCGAPLFKPSSAGGVVSLEVENFDDAMVRLKERQVKILFGPHETPVCHMTVISDPDDNTIIVHKRKKN